MENKDITAEWANRTAKAVLGEKVQKQVDTCLAAIYNAVKQNNMSVGVSMYADKMTIAELEKRGFKTSQHDDQRDGSYLEIRW